LCVEQSCPKPTETTEDATIIVTEIEIEIGEGTEMEIGIRAEIEIVMMTIVAEIGTETNNGTEQMQEEIMDAIVVVMQTEIVTANTHHHASKL
jgi:hypothetical protein